MLDLKNIHTAFIKIILVTQVQMHYSIQTKTPERLLPCYKLLLHDTIASTNPKLFLFVFYNHFITQFVQFNP